MLDLNPVALKSFSNAPYKGRFIAIRLVTENEDQCWMGGTLNITSNVKLLVPPEAFIITFG